MLLTMLFGLTPFLRVPTSCMAFFILACELAVLNLVDSKDSRQYRKRLWVFCHKTLCLSPTDSCPIMARSTDLMAASRASIIKTVLFAFVCIRCRSISAIAVPRRKLRVLSKTSCNKSYFQCLYGEIIFTVSSSRTSDVTLQATSSILSYHEVKAKSISR